MESNQSPKDKRQTEQLQGEQKKMTQTSEQEKEISFFSKNKTPV